MYKGMIIVKVNIEVHLNIEGSKIMSAGPFDVNKQEFVKDAEFTAAVEAYKFIQSKWRESGCRDMKIEKVIYDGVNDITEITRQIRPVVDDSWLPF